MPKLAPLHRDILDNAGLTRYTQAMPKRTPEPQSAVRLKLLGVKLPEDVLEEIQQISDSEKRTKSQVGALLIMRALRLYREDKVLLESDAEDGKQGRR